MIRLRVGYVITGIITGLLLVLSFFTTIPDGKLHVILCDVGQGDGIYIRFPDGKDMIVDGGPGNKIIGCLSRHMQFWDRTIDMVLLTHPQKDHLNGLISVLERYRIEYFVRSDVHNATDGFEKLKTLVKQKHIAEKFVTAGETITVGPSILSVVWPSKEQIALMKPSYTSYSSSVSNTGSVLGAATNIDLNDGSVVLSLSYGTFDALFMGDADSRVQGKITSSLRPGLAQDGILELFKVPHHGSKTGLTDAFLQKISFTRPVLVKQDFSLSQKKPLAVISVGQNSYGHPSSEIIQKLESAGFHTLRTDKEGDIEIVSDGTTWSYTSSKN